MKAIFLIIKSRFRHRKFLNGLLISLVAISVITLNIALALCNGFETRFLNKIISFPPQISVSYKSAPDFGGLKTDFKKILSITQGQALAINTDNHRIQGISIKGTKYKDISRLLDKKNLIIGKYPQNNEILIGDKLAENLGIGVGNTIKIVCDPLSFMDLKVSGIFKIGLYDFDSSVVIIPKNNLIQLSKTSLFSNLSTIYGIWLKNPYSAKQIAFKISQINPAAGVSNWQDDNRALVNALGFEKKVVFTVLSLLIIGAGASISIVQIMHILNQKGQIAVLSAIGFTPKKILGLYTLEGFFLGAFGIIIGIIISFIISFGFSHSGINLPISVYNIDNLAINMQISDLFWISITTMVLTLVASTIPAIYASKLSPIEILRN